MFCQNFLVPTRKGCDPKQLTAKRDRERDRERQRDRETDKQRQREREREGVLCLLNCGGLSLMISLLQA